MVAEKAGEAGGKRLSVVCPVEGGNWWCELAELRSASDVIFLRLSGCGENGGKWKGEEKEFKVLSVQFVFIGKIKWGFTEEYC